MRAGKCPVCQDCACVQFNRREFSDECTGNAAPAAHDRRHGDPQHVAIDPDGLRSRGQELQALFSTIAEQADVRGGSFLSITSGLAGPGSHDDQPDYAVPAISRRGIRCRRTSVLLRSHDSKPQRHSSSISRPCVEANGWSLPSVRSRARSKCSPILPVTLIAS